MTQVAADFTRGFSIAELDMRVANSADDWLTLSGLQGAAMDASATEARCYGGEQCEALAVDFEDISRTIAIGTCGVSLEVMAILLGDSISSNAASEILEMPTDCTEVHLEIRAWAHAKGGKQVGYHVEYARIDMASIGFSPAKGAYVMHNFRAIPLINQTTGKLGRWIRRNV